MEKIYEKAADDLLRASSVVALTGAGISVESGIPPFRGKGGLWERFDPVEFGSIQNFLRQPKRVWELLLIDLKGVIERAMPNNAHLGLAELEGMGRLKTVITQNVDGLHQKAGNTDVVEFHGNCATMRCDDCGTRTPTPDVETSVLPPRCACGGLIRPDWVFFGEAIPPEAMIRSQEAARSCDLMLVIGTSAVVQPAAYIPVFAREAGAKVIEINPEPTDLTGRISDYIVQERAGAAMTAIMGKIRERLG